MKPKVLSCLVFMVCAINQAGCGSYKDLQGTATESGVPGVPSSTVTVTPTQRSSSTPVLTITPDPSIVQIQRLYDASLSYLADSDDKTWLVAIGLGYAPLGGYPSNMCGPLAISILKDAGIVSQAANLHDFWLLDPKEDGELLQEIFPAAQFDWLHTDQPINQVDYRQFPLMAGDLVYIYSGKRGDFSHVLAVTRVDADGKAYSVTNNYTDDGFMVQEYMLYDPTNPGTGMFYSWTDTRNRELGLTGFGGMDIWRPRQLPFYADGKP